ncbi:MAG: hypothetical protein II736_03315 [Clostridia bacterium]|nr:hypothetical protein [Clostridia bacterium]
MKKISLVLALLAVLACSLALLSCEREPAGTPENSSSALPETEGETGETAPLPAEDFAVRSFSDFNAAGTLDSHAADGKACLEASYRENYEFTNSLLKATKPYYPRIKKMADGRYVMFYQQGQHSWNTYVTTGDEIGKWKTPTVLFAQQSLPEVGDTRCYMTCDGVVLSNGDILAVASFRANKLYTKRPELGGLAMRRSSDNGKTWTPIEVIYVGVNWEPYVYQTKSGEVQVFFTQISPKIAQENTTGSSGVGMIRSTDGGKTWTPNVTEAPYRAHTVAQLLTKTENGVKIFSDQMPSVIELHSGKMAMAVEDRYPAASGKDTYSLSMIYSEDNWATSVGYDEQGPKNRKTKMFSAAGPYLAQFPSGEVLLTYHWANALYYRFSNGDATGYAAAQKAFSDCGFWGSSLIDGDRRVIISTNKRTNAGESNETDTLRVARFYLNHALTAKKHTVTVDGRSGEWDENTETFFLGSESQAQTSIGTAYDGEYFYLLAETLDQYVTSGDKVAFYLSNGARAFYRILVNADGTATVSYDDGSAGFGASLKEKKDAGVLTAAAVSGKIDDPEGTDNGYVIEVAIPASQIDLSEGKLSFNAILYNRDSQNGKTVSDSFDTANVNSMSTWFDLTLS